MITGKSLAEFAGDIQTGLGRFEVPDFDDLRLIGMAATLAVQLRGLPEIEYSTLQQVSNSRFDIPAPQLKGVLRLLSEIGMVKLYESGRSITKIDPQVPFFEDVYETVGQASSEYVLNETEQATVHIMAELSKSPANSDKMLAKSGIEKRLWDRCMEIGSTGGLIAQHRQRGRTILTSPIYVADNSEELADLIAKTGSDDFRIIMNVLQRHQGWPLSMIIKQQAIAGEPLTSTQVELAGLLAGENLLKPPSIEIGDFRDAFLFTPRPGSARLSPGKREIYERAMALLAAVRKGQLLPFKYSIRKPAVMLTSLLDKGYLKANTEAYRQYGKVAATHNVGYFEEKSPGWHRFCLRQTEENVEAVKLAIDLSSNETDRVDMRQDAEARALMQMDDTFVRSALAAKAIKERPQVMPGAEALEQWTQLTLKLVS